MYVIWFPVNILSGQPWVTITNNLWKLKERSIQNILTRWYFFSISESETDDQSHTFISLQDVEEQIKSEFAEVLKKVSLTITTMCKTEKQAWLRMDEVEEECQRLTKQVETAAQKLVWYPALLSTICRSCVARAKELYLCIQCWYPVRIVQLWNKSVNFLTREASELLIIIIIIIVYLERLINLHSHEIFLMVRYPLWHHQIVLSGSRTTNLLIIRQ